MSKQQLILVCPYVLEKYTRDSYVGQEMLYTSAWLVVNFVHLYKIAELYTSDQHSEYTLLHVCNPAM